MFSTCRSLARSRRAQRQRSQTQVSPATRQHVAVGGGGPGPAARRTATPPFSAATNYTLAAPTQRQQPAHRGVAESDMIQECGRVVDFDARSVTAAACRRDVTGAARTAARTVNTILDEPLIRLRSSRSTSTIGEIESPRSVTNCRSPPADPRIPGLRGRGKRFYLGLFYPTMHPEFKVDHRSATAKHLQVFLGPADAAIRALPDTIRSRRARSGNPSA